MATKSTSSKPRSTRTGASAASKSAGPAPAKGGFPPAAGAWTPDLEQLFKQLQVPGVNLEGMLAARKLDIEALVHANQEMVEGMRVLAQRQTEIAHETLREWQQAMQHVGAGRAAPNLGSQTELAQQAFGKALGNLRELTELAVKSQTRVFELIQKRSAENLEEMRRTMQPKK